MKEHGRSRAGIYPSTSSLITSQYPTSINPPIPPLVQWPRYAKIHWHPTREKPWPFPQSRHNSVNHTWHYTIVNSDTKDQHQYSVIVSAATIYSAHNPVVTQAHTDPRLTKHVSTIHVSLPSTRTHNTKNLTHRYNNSQIQHAASWEIDSTTNEYSSWRYPIRSGGPPCKTQCTRQTT